MKKFIALFLVAAVCLGLTACDLPGSNGDTAKYEKYDELIGYMENENYDAAIEYIYGFYEDESEDMSGDFSDDEDDSDMAWRYDDLMYQLNEVLDGYGIWAEDTEEYLEGSAALAYLYQQFVAMGDYKDCAQIASRFVCLPNMLLYTEYTEVDNLDNANDYDGTHYYYDEQGAILKLDNPNLDYYNPLGSLWGDLYFFYEGGTLVQIKAGYESDGKIDAEAVVDMVYDQGMLTAMEIKTDDGDEYHVELAYTEDGKLDHWVRCENSYQFGMSYIYDVKGNLQQETVEVYYIYSDGDEELEDIITREYHYDAKGNLTTMTETVLYGYYSYDDEFTSQQVNQYSYETDKNGVILSYTIEYGMQVYDGEEKKPSYVSETARYIYGDYYFYNAE